MATTTIGSNPSTNFWAWDRTMGDMYIGDYSISGLGRMINCNCFFAGQVAGSGGGDAYKGGSLVMGPGSNSIPAGNGGAANIAQAVASCAWFTSTGDVATTSTDTWRFGASCSGGLYTVYLQPPGTDSTDATHAQTFTVHFGTGGAIPGYGTYFILARWVKRTGSMKQAFRYVKRSGAETLAKRWVKRAGVWIQVARLAENLEFEPGKTFECWERDENGLWLPGILEWEGPYYLGPAWAREFHLHGAKAITPAPYVLKRAA